MRIAFISCFLVISSLGLCAQESAVPSTPAAELTFAFWNVENLFDYEDDPNNWGDDEYLPAKGWDQARYQRKLTHLAEVIATVKPHLLGFCEIENRRVLNDLVAHDLLKVLGYQVVHADSPDKRGIDLGLIYRAPFEIVGDASTAITIHPIDLGAKSRPTRGVYQLAVQSRDQKLHVLLNHWPSRGGGEKSVGYRNTAALVARQVVDTLLAADANSDILILGDFNDEPFDPSIRKTLGAIRSRNDVLNRRKTKHLLNLSWKLLAQPDYGTYYYNRDWKWNVLDQAIISKGMLDQQGWTYVDGSLETYGPDKLRDKYRRPLRFRRRGKNWSEGYSDHFMIYGRMTVQAGASSEPKQ